MWNNLRLEKEKDRISVPKAGHSQRYARNESTENYVAVIARRGNMRPNEHTRARSFCEPAHITLTHTRQFSAKVESIRHRKGKQPTRRVADIFKRFVKHSKSAGTSTLFFSPLFLLFFQSMRLNAIQNDASLLTAQLERAAADRIPYFLRPRAVVIFTER